MRPLPRAAAPGGPAHIVSGTAIVSGTTVSGQAPPCPRAGKGAGGQSGEEGEKEDEEERRDEEEQEARARPGGPRSTLT